MSLTFKKMTRPEMRKLQAGKTISEHGIEFRRQSDGDGVFAINIMVDGKRIHRIVGNESDGTTRSQAEDYIVKIRQEAKENRLNLPQGRKTSLRFREAASAYIERLQNEGGKNIEKKKSQLKLHLVPYFSDLPLSKITSSEVEKYKQHRLEQRILPKHKTKTEPTKITTPATVNRELALLSHIFNMAVEWNWIDHRPAAIKRLKEDNNRIVYLTAEQSARLLQAAEEDQNRQIYPFILIGLNTSMRTSEILSVKKEHIDIAKRLIHIPKAKAGAREQPITKKLANFLSEYINTLQPGTPWIFPSPAAASGHTVTVIKAFKRCVQRAGLDERQIVGHTLRHTAITQLVQAGVDLPTVKRISGHKTLSMVERYSHQNGAHIESAMDRLEAQYS